MLKLPLIQGIIRRRILVNFRLEPEIVQGQIPSKFRPKLHDGSAVAGICLIRLEQIRPKYFPALIGHSSENAAHRIAVLWETEDGALQEGVFIPRRDTNSMMNHVAGGRFFPGEHHYADFRISDTGQQIDLSMKSKDGAVAVEIRAATVNALPVSSRFRDLAQASAFFEPGSLGYSATQEADRLDGLRLKTKTWKVEALDVQHVYSSYFADERRFPKGSVHFDCALIMRDIQHEWQSERDLYI